MNMPQKQTQIQRTDHLWLPRGRGGGEEEDREFGTRRRQL